MSGPETVVLPSELERDALNAMKKIGAYVGSSGDPSVMDSFKEPASKLTLFLITAGLTLVAYIIAEISNYNEISKNWAHYRCMPSIAPFSKFYGHDLSETMNFCISQSVKDHAPGVIDPIYAGINKVTGVVDGVYNKVVSIEGGIAGLLSGLESFIINFVNSFRLLGVRVRMSFVRVKEIFTRIYGLFIAFAYAAISAITFGENLACNPLVQFMGTITGVDICCFAPDTSIIMADGSTKPITRVRIGDLLQGGAEVETTYRFSGDETKMKRLFGVHVSGNHYVRVTDRMIPVGEHPEAVDAECLPRLWCLGTSTHTIPVLTGGRRRITFADYEESSDPAIIAEVQRIAEMELNSGPHAGPTVPDYSLGLDAGFQVFMANGTWKSIVDVHVDEELMGGGIVKGVIRELCETQVKTPGGHWVSAAQLILHEGIWQRAANIWSTAVEERESILCHLMITNNASITVRDDDEVFLVRDYAELTSPAVQAPYDRVLAGGKS